MAFLRVDLIVLNAMHIKLDLFFLDFCPSLVYNVFFFFGMYENVVMSMVLFFKLFFIKKIY
jgi:hypothetical protein